MRQRGGPTASIIVKYEAGARRQGHIVHPDEAKAWDDLRASFEMKRAPGVGATRRSFSHLASQSNAANILTKRTNEATIWFALLPLTALSRKLWPGVVSAAVSSKLPYR